MKKFNKKSLALLIVAALLLTITVSGTVAYLVDSTGSLVNTFTPTSVSTDVDDNVTGNTKSEVDIINTSDIPVYMRVAVVANWVKDGKIVQAWQDHDDLKVKAKWIGARNGMYYYNGTVDAGAEVRLFDSYTATGGPEGAHLEMDIIAQVIQAEPTSAVQEAWGFVPGSN